MSNIEQRINNILNKVGIEECYIEEDEKNFIDVRYQYSDRSVKFINNSSLYKDEDIIWYLAEYVWHVFNKEKAEAIKGLVI